MAMGTMLPRLAVGISRSGPTCEVRDSVRWLQAICIGVPGGRLARATQSWPLSNACVAAQCNDDGSLSVLIKKLTSSGYETHSCPEGENIDLSVIDGFQPGVRCHCPLSVASRMQALQPCVHHLVYFTP